MQKQFHPLRLWLLIFVISTSIGSYAQKESKHAPTSTSKIKAVVAPLNVGDIGPQVKNLTSILLLLVEHKVIKSFEAPYRPLADELKNICSTARQEMGTSTFGPATRGLVSHFQVQNGVSDGLSGNVDVDTAVKLNESLKALGIVAPPRQRP